MIEATGGNGLDGLIRDFEKAWLVGPAPKKPPQLEDFVANLDGDKLISALILLIPIDVKFGKFLDLEKYFQIWPSLREHKATLEQAIQRNTISDQEAGSTSKSRGSDSSVGTPESNSTSKWGTRFKLLEELGRGSFGIVHKAHDTWLDHIVALKVVNPARADEARKLFHHEARNAGRIGRHPNIVQILERGDDFLVYEYIPGKTLLALLRKTPRLDPSEAATILSSIARAVQHSHQSEVIHLDIKPANILIREKDNAPLLTDYGISIREEQLIRLRGSRGTPYYMAPEQVSGKTTLLSPRTDIWALGVVLYECLTGVLPFSGNGNELTERILRFDPFRVRNRHDAVPQQLDDICQSALKKSPADRYQSAAAMADDLDTFLRGDEARVDRALQVVYTTIRRVVTAARSIDPTRRRGLIALAGTLAMLVCLFFFNVMFPYRPYRTDVSRLLNNYRWVTYDPREFHPEFNPRPSIDSITSDLQLVLAAGFTGIVTFSSKESLADIPRVWKELAKRNNSEVAVIMGVWDPASRDEINRASQQRGYVDAYCVGHNGLTRHYYIEDLQHAISLLRQKARRPVTTSDEFPRYIATPELAEVGDWVFPDVHNSLNIYTYPLLGSHDPVKDSVGMHIEFTRSMAQLANQAGKPLMLKMVTFPHHLTIPGSELEFGESAQKDFFEKLCSGLKLPESRLPVDVNIVAHSAFDITWKRPPQFNFWDAYTGLIDKHGKPRPAVEEIYSP